MNLGHAIERVTRWKKNYKHTCIFASPLSRLNSLLGWKNELALVLSLSCRKIVIVFLLQALDEPVQEDSSNESYNTTAPSCTRQASAEGSIFSTEQNQFVELRVGALVEVGTAAMTGIHQIAQSDESRRGLLIK